jgi:hypothetical protein
MNEEEQKQRQEEAYAAIACLIGVAIVATVAGEEGKRVFPELRKILMQIR